MATNFRTPPIARHPAYPSIVAEYNKILHRDGKVVNAKFWPDFVQVHGISRSSWFNFVKNYVTNAGLVVPSAPASVNPTPLAVLIPTEQTVLPPGQTVSPREIVSAPIAIQRGIAAAMNIGLEALNDILSGKVLLNPKEKTELLFKAMKAQDSRINAVARMKKDRREEVAFDQVFGESAYASDGDNAQPHE